MPEWLMGISGLRKEIAALAKGHVLEVAIGTGRNFAYYDWTEVSSEEDEAGRQDREKKRVKKMLELHRRRIKDGDKADGFDTEKAKLPGNLDGEVLSFTGVDISGDMMSVARSKIRDSVPGLRKLMRRRRAEPMPDGPGVVVDVLDSRVRLHIADAEQPFPPPPILHGTTPSTKYDTIIQSFGLCSVSDPSKVLSNMAAMVQPGSGRIILLEHGRGWFNWVNGLLDQYADRHFQRYGCWWNRDIEAIIREAAKNVPGLEVVSIGRPLLLQAGTTLVIELRVKSASR
jgi:methyltransferase OMS1